jgi:hypothetical protein
MKLSQMELGSVAALIVYIAFFTHPAPYAVTSLLANPIVKAVVLLGTLYVAVYYSMVIGLFLGLAYVMSTTGALEHYTAPPPKVETPHTSQGIPPAAISGMMKALNNTKKGDPRVHQTSGKTDAVKPEVQTPPKPAPPTKVEHFSSF